MTMPNRERADILKQEADTLYQESWDLQAKAGKLLSARSTTWGEIIKEEKLLAKCPWVFNTFITGFLRLDAMGTWDDFPEVVELLEPDHHDNFRLGSREAGPRLCFSDGAMWLDLERDTAEEMIQALGISIDITALQTKVDRLEQSRLDTIDLLSLMRRLRGVN